MDLNNSMVSNVQSKIALIIMLFIVGLIVIELIFRFANPIDYFHHSTPWAKEMFHHSLKPGSFKKTYGDITITYKINSLGLRDFEYDVPKPPNVYRILVLGDSFVFGEGVDIEDVWVKILEQRIRAKSSSIQIEIINGGIWGYSPIVEYLFFKNRLIRLQPDLVLQCIFSNDISEDYAFSLIAEYDSSGQLIKIPHSIKPNSLPIKQLVKRDNWLFKNSYLIKYLIWIAEKIVPQKSQLVKGDILTDPFAHCDEQPPDWQEHYDRTIFYVKAVADLCRQNNIDYISTLLPGERQLSSKGLFDILTSAARQNNFTFWNFYHDFNRRLKNEHYNKKHGHLTEAGNYVLADIFYNELITTKLCN